MLALTELDTPQPVIDRQIMRANIAAMQALCNQHHIANTPHFKTHKSVELAKLQLAAGATALCCQTLSEAEVIAHEIGCDVIICHQLLGAAKIERLRQVASMVNLTMICDNAVVAKYLSECFAALSTPVDILVECDTGMARSGVVAPQTAASLAKYISTLPGLNFAGLLLYPPDDQIERAQAFLDQARQLIEAEGLSIARISNGGTPGLPNIGILGETEYRAGTNIFHDRMQMGKGVATDADCALTIYTTLVSSAEPGRGILDAGSKTLTSDLTLFDDFGYLPDYPNARIYKLAEEHGFLDFSQCEHKPQIGEIIRVIPNHVCPVVNLQDEILSVEDGTWAAPVRVDARGRRR
ncbi:MAG: alanine racemase [Gammaproteobacteria bacterium]|nr:alanine racemase [Gammaproteobacteria bacterium]